MPKTTGLREWKKVKTRDQIIETTIQLCLKNGFKKVTIQEIVDSLDISRRTFFRYFRSKEDVVIERIGEYCGEVITELESRPKQEPVWTSLVEAFSRFIKRCTTNSAGMLALHKMMMENPSLLARKYEMPSQWEAALLPEVRKRLKRGGQQSINARILVSAVISCTNVAFEHWHEIGAEGRLDKIAGLAFTLGKPALVRDA